MDKSSVLVTGCDTGLGLALCALLPHHGYFVIAICQSEAGQRRTNRVINGEPSTSEGVPRVDSEGWLVGKKGVSYVLDITLINHVELFREQLAKRIANKEIPPLYSVINNAGIWRFSMLTDAFESLESRQAEVNRWREVFETNVIGSLQITTAFAGHLTRSADNLSPRIFFVSSVLDKHSLPGQSAYVASKYAINGLHETLCHELAATDITPIIVKPGPLRNTNLFIRDLNLNEPGLLLNAAGDCRHVAQTILYGLRQRYPKYEYSNFIGTIPFKIAEYVPRKIFVHFVRLVLRKLALLYFTVRRLVFRMNFWRR
ncbi:putative oxidoreductase YbbO [Babesia sp. Xinjiang]|uniref:putative oxidoreductase YbbO n=1 Tax=Babesia sp. Xinjiang TaxID=462227 RepID=UPI000A23A2B0|nr:putative oxidoreductase YbbO [Babesia sp. Xinjiang]ORM39390.1 putative oxidoreductase YbbO [Babesia sp. Xinjiang]